MREKHCWLAGLGWLKSTSEQAAKLGVNVNDNCLLLCCLLLVVLFVSFIIYTVKILFFSHNKSAEIVFLFVFSAKRTPRQISVVLADSALAGRRRRPESWLLAAGKHAGRLATFRSGMSWPHGVALPTTTSHEFPPQPQSAACSSDVRRRCSETGRAPGGSRQSMRSGRGPRPSVRPRVASHPAPIFPALFERFSPLFPGTPGPPASCPLRSACGHPLADRRGSVRTGTQLSARHHTSASVPC